jgi:hypothetical protein
MAYLHSITFRQTRNHLATDGHYIASNRTTLPDTRRAIRSAILSNLGFGTLTQSFDVRYIPSCLHAPLFILVTGHFLNGKRLSWPRGPLANIPTSCTRRHPLV